MLILDAFILYWFMNMFCIEVESFRRVNHASEKSLKLGSHIRTEDENQNTKFKSIERLEVTSQVYDTAENFENLGIKRKPAKSSFRSDSKRFQGVFKLQKSNKEAPNQQEDPLPLEVVESLVMSIQENSNKNISDIVKDIHNKLDMVYNKKVGGPKMLRSGAPTEEPKDVIQEMDKILKEFLRKGKSEEIIAAPSAGNNRYANTDDDEGPYMRGSDRFEPRPQDTNLEYDLDGGELSVAWKNI